MGLRKWLTLMGVGAGLMYYYDPEQGRRRRALLRDQWTHMQHESQDFWSKAQRDLQNRRQGIQSQPPSLTEMPGGIDGLAGQWTPGVRLVAAAAGGGLTFYGMLRGGLTGTAATIFGLNLVSRGITNSGLGSLMGGGRGDASQSSSAETMPASSAQAGSSQAASGSRSERSTSSAGSSTERAVGASGSAGGKNQAASNQSLTSQQGADRGQGAGAQGGRPRGDAGAQGRTDQVGQSGVYPASDPKAPPDARAQGMASWGQGERGAAGYEDSGSSELNLGGETGGFDSIVPGKPEHQKPENRKPDHQKPDNQK